MQRWLIFCVFVCLVITASSRKSVGSLRKLGESSIIGGFPIDIEQAPHQVQVFKYGRFACGGAIITSTTILTAAHCVPIKKPSVYKVRAGSTFINETGTEHSVDSLIVHPKFNSSDYDVAIIILRNQVLFDERRKPIKIRRKELAEGSWVQVTGWGATSAPIRSVNHLMAVKIQTTNRDDCAKQYYDIEGAPKVTERMICAGGGVKTPCHGDSGGPLTFHAKLVGVVSWGMMCKPDYPSVFSNLANPEIYTWLTSQIE